MADLAAAGLEGSDQASLQHKRWHPRMDQKHKTAVSKRITSTSSSASSSTILTPTCDTTVTVQTRGVGPRQRIVHRIGVAVEALGIGDVVAAIVGIGAQPATLRHG